MQPDFRFSFIPLFGGWAVGWLLSSLVTEKDILDPHLVLNHLGWGSVGVVFGILCLRAMNAVSRKYARYDANRRAEYARYYKENFVPFNGGYMHKDDFAKLPIKEEENDAASVG